MNESNIDRNRNCHLDTTFYSTENTGYTRLKGMLNPTEEANRESLRDQPSILFAAEKLVIESMKSFRQAIVQGQYNYPDGLYFGGKKLEPQIKSVAS